MVAGTRGNVGPGPLADNKVAPEGIVGVTRAHLDV